jgi:cell division protein FtsZ
MALVKPDASRIAKIKVIGVGGGGGNAVASMVEGNTIDGVEFIVVNTDAQVLLDNTATTKLQIGEKLTRGLGVGGNPEIGSQAAEESQEKLKELLQDSDMVFITAGMGGGTGTGASPVVARIAKEIGALTVGIVTKPFAFEGARRSNNAEEGIERLRDEVDTLIVIPNQRLMDVVDRKMTLIEAFKIVDGVLGQAVTGIAEIITTPGLVNVDFADVKTIMKDAGTALLGIGVGVGENRAQMAARAAISSPLLDLSIDGARGVLFNVTGGSDLTMYELDEAARIISSAADPDANVIFGSVIKTDMSDQVRITVVATGFDETQARLSKFARPVESGARMEGVIAEPRNQMNDQNDERSMGEDSPRSVFSAPQPVNQAPDEKQDEFGDDFEIPAFLRKVH